MKIKYILILLILFSCLSSAETTFVPLAEYEKKSLTNYPKNNINSDLFLFFRLNLSTIANLDDDTVVRISKFDIKNNYTKNKRYPIETIFLLKGYKNTELIKLLIPMFNALNYESIQKIPLTTTFSKFYSEFVKAIAYQSFEDKASILKNRLDYWLLLYNSPDGTALEKWEKNTISDCIMLLTETLHFYHKKVLTEKEYSEISKKHLIYPHKYKWLTSGYNEERNNRFENRHPIQSIPLKAEYTNFKDLIEDKIYFKSLLEKYPINSFDPSNTVGDIIYHQNKALIQFRIGEERGGNFLLEIKGKEIIVKTLSTWVV